MNIRREIFDRLLFPFKSRTLAAVLWNVEHLPWVSSASHRCHSTETLTGSTPSAQSTICRNACLTSVRSVSFVAFKLIGLLINWVPKTDLGQTAAMRWKSECQLTWFILFYRRCHCWVSRLAGPSQTAAHSWMLWLCWIACMTWFSCTTGAWEHWRTWK